MSGDELTPEERRRLEAIDRALSGRAVDPDLEDVAALTRELRDSRVRPRPEFARMLDERAAGWADRPAPQRRRQPWLRLAVPAMVAAAAAVVAIAVVGGGGDEEERTTGGGQLELVAVESADTAGREAAPEGAAPQAAPRSGAPGADAADVFFLDRRRATRDDSLPVSYRVSRSTTARVELAGRSGEIELDPGEGTLEVGTGGIEPGRYDLEITMGPLGPVREPVEIVDGG